MNKYSHLALVIAFCTACDDDSSYVQGPLRLGTSADPSFAVTLRDKDEAAIGLLDSSGEIVRAVYVDSKTELLDRALHDQLAIPSNPELEGVLTVLNKAPADSVLRIDYFNGKVLADVSTRPDEGEDFAVDPRDYLYLDESHAWVTRYEPNLEPDAEGLSLGDDLLLIEPDNGKLVDRIDLSSLYEDVRYEAEDGEMVTALAYARPCSLIGLEDDQAYVGLDRLSADSQAAAPGAGLVLDLDKAKFVTVEFGALRRCGKAVAVAKKRDAVIVSCAGHPLGDRASSGLAYVEIGAGKGVVKYTFRPEGDTPVAIFSPVSLGGTRVVVTERGELSGGDDALHLLDLKSGELEEIERFESANVLGEGGAFQPAEALLLIANRVDSRILRFVVDGKGVKSIGSLALESDLDVDGVFALKRF
jgi:hypothetical protein